MNKTILIASVLILALGLEISGAIFSVIGLTSLFAGAEVQIFVIASLLESSKLILASYLHSYWNSVNRIIRIYLSSALVVIALITSFGIYGSLIGAYQKTKTKLEIVDSNVSKLQSKLSYFQSSLQNIELQITSKVDQVNSLQNFRSSQESRSDRLIEVNRSTKSIDNSLRETSSRINVLNSDIDSLNRNKIIILDSITTTNIAITQSKLENQHSSELGAMSFIAATFGISIDLLVNILIVVLLFVIDPLAICMIIVFNSLRKSPAPLPATKAEHHSETGLEQAIMETKDSDISSEVPTVYAEESAGNSNADVGPKRKKQTGSPTYHVSTQ